jgi:hypothetical protein
VDVVASFLLQDRRPQATSHKPQAVLHLKSKIIILKY